MFKHLEDFKVHMNRPIEDERTIRILNMFYATILFALVGFPIEWCALGFAGYIYIEAMRVDAEQRMYMDEGNKRIDEILKMKEVPMYGQSDDEDDEGEISSYTKNTGMGAVGLADGRHIKFGDSDSDSEDDGEDESEEDSDYDPQDDSQPETDDEQAEQSDEQAEQSGNDSTDEFIKSVDKMFNVKVGRENVTKNPLYKKNKDEEFTMINDNDFNKDQPALGSSSCTIC